MITTLAIASCAIGTLYGMLSGHYVTGLCAWIVGWAIFELAGRFDWWDK